MRKKSRISFIVVFIMLITHSLYAITGDEALNKFRARMSSIGKLTGIISWSGPEGETYTGAFKYNSVTQVAKQLFPMVELYGSIPLEVICVEFRIWQGVVQAG